MTMLVVDYLLVGLLVAVVVRMAFARPVVVTVLLPWVLCWPLMIAVGLLKLNKVKL